MEQRRRAVMLWSLLVLVVATPVWVALSPSGEHALVPVRATHMFRRG